MAESPRGDAAPKASTRHVCEMRGVFPRWWEHELEGKADRCCRKWRDVRGGLAFEGPSHIKTTITCQDRRPPPKHTQIHPHQPQKVVSFLSVILRAVCVCVCVPSQVRTAVPRTCSCTAPSPASPSASGRRSHPRSSSGWSAPSRRTTTWWEQSASSWPMACA